MKKNLYLALCLCALLFCGCSHGCVDVENPFATPTEKFAPPTEKDGKDIDTTLLALLPSLSEYILDKPLDFAKDVLVNAGYTYNGADEYGITSLERGEKNSGFFTGVEEIVYLQLRNDTVRSVEAFLSFLTIQDAISAYRDWTNCIWQTVLPNPSEWTGETFRAAYVENGEIVNGELQYYYDDARAAQEQKPNRAAFTQMLANLTNIYSINEWFDRASDPKEVRLELMNASGEIWIGFSNQNFISGPVHCE